MKLTFDYYHNLENVDFYLCNPDGRELFPISGVNRNLTLRFNDLSELTFDVYPTATTAAGERIWLESYEYVETKRLIYVTNIGWFQITNVTSKDDGEMEHKSVTAESYQTVLKNKGFISEERVYCFYNPSDPFDDHYTAQNNDADESVRASAIPSVLGQMKRQLGIQQDLRQGLSDPNKAYDDWTVTYINNSLIFSDNDGICRTFKESTTYGYDWIVNDVEEAFEVVVSFDFMYKTIHVMTPEEVAQKTNIVYSFSNFMKDVEIEEASEDIVTVLNCNGDNCDITTVNPTGTNYICDFSYYMDEVSGRWMSSDLINKLKAWKIECEANKETYEKTVESLRSAWVSKTQCDEGLQENSLRLKDLKEASAKRMSRASSAKGGDLIGIISVETVDVGETSVNSNASFSTTPFTGSTVVRAYKEQPEYSNMYYTWNFSGDYMEDTADNIVRYNHSDGNTDYVQYLYFRDDSSSGRAYCKLNEKSKVDSVSGTATYVCGGFDRYISYCCPETTSAGTTVYVDKLQEWINVRESIVNSLNGNNSYLHGTIDALVRELDAISSKLNIISYFSDTPSLLRELNCYWIEGEYNNENIAVLDETTPAQEIDLSNQLLDAGEKELSKVCQPRFSFSLESANVMRQYEFRHQMSELELGKIITIERSDGVWYYPALLEISMSLDSQETFSMTFANAMRLDDWGYTYADLISDASSTSRQVSANWQDIISYSKDKNVITSLIKNPLDTTLRAGFANMINQEFTIDSSGILGRKKLSESSEDFEDEQVRMINNLILFTDDGWETSRTALGKIYYTDENGDQVSSYGLLAETIIGSLIMGERMSIINSDSSIQMDGSGLRIIKRGIDGESEDTVVFEARTDGAISVRGYALQSVVEDKDAENKTLIAQNANAITAQASSIDGLRSRIDVMAGEISLKASSSDLDSLSERVEGELKVQADNISAKVSSSGGSGGFGWSLTSDGFYLDSNGGRVFSATASGVTVTGTANITGGSLNIADNFIVDTDGNVQLNGSISWGAGSSPTRAVYASSNTTTPPNGSGWHQTFADGDLYASYSHDGGATWTDAIRIVGEKGDTGDRGPQGEQGPRGEQGADGEDGSDAEVNYYNVFNALTNNGSIRGMFDGTSGELYINADYINSGFVNALKATISECTISNCTITNDCTIQGTLTSDTIHSNSSDFKITSNASGYTIGSDSAGIHAYKSLARMRSSGGAYVEAYGNMVNLKANAVQMLNSDGGEYASFGSGTVTVSAGNITIGNSNTNSVLYLYNNKINVGRSADNGGYIYEDSNFGYLYGKWKAASAIEITSDKEKKNTISEISDAYTAIFDQLKPVTFKYNDGTSDRLHTGFIAQDVEQAVIDAGLTTKEFAAICYDIDEDGNKVDYGIRYSELVALLVKEVQSLKAEIASLKEA